MVQLEAGYRYVTEDGSVVGPIWKNKNWFGFSFNGGEQSIEWNEQGRVIYYGGTGPCFKSDVDFHIVEEFRIHEGDKYRLNTGDVISGLKYNPKKNVWEYNSFQFSVDGRGVPAGNYRIDQVLDYKKEEKTMKSPVTEKTVKTINTGKFGPKNGLTVDQSIVSFRTNLIGIQKSTYSAEELLWFSSALKEMAEALKEHDCE